MEPAETLFANIGGADIEVLAWGERGRPGVLLAHGSCAHARWWSPVAAMLATEFRVASLSWSGMGGSQWRDSYCFEQQADELFAAADDLSRGYIEMSQSYHAQRLELELQRRSQYGYGEWEEKSLREVA